jgi:hypothetical protein
VATLKDHWTVVTRDGLPSVHVEHTLALTPDGKVMVITADEEPQQSPPTIVGGLSAPNSN